MADVFISYKQEERDAVRLIAEKLRELKLDVWFDEKLRTGESFDENINANLKAAKAVLVCWTPAAIASEWVRGEAAIGFHSGRLAACFLAPTELLPPFNLMHAENLATWGGQDDDSGWLKLLQRIGELSDRPGLATYYTVMQPEAAAPEVRAWAEANGADPLVDTVWARLGSLEKEDDATRLERQKAEARAADEKRRAQAARSRELMRARNLRDPVRERRRFMALVGAVALVALLVVGATAYILDAQTRERALNDAHDVAHVRSFLAQNNLHPVSALARAKLTSLDVEAWDAARQNGSIASLQHYLADARPAPHGAYIAQAEQALKDAQQTLEAQRILSRRLIYRGALTGAKDADTSEAIRIFCYRVNRPVSDTVDASLLAQLHQALAVWLHPRVEDLRASDLFPPDEIDLSNIANEIHVEPAVLQAVARVESGNLKAFESDGRPLILFEAHLFGYLTHHRFDASHPTISTTAMARAPSSHSARWRQLSEAYALDPDAAISATAFGRFGTIAMRYRDYGFETPGEFARFLSQSEYNQFEAFARLAKAKGLVAALQSHDWAVVARGYSGARTPTYQHRLTQAYDAIVAQHTMANAMAPPANPEGAEIEDDGVGVPNIGLPDFVSRDLMILVIAIFGAGTILLWPRRRA